MECTKISPKFEDQGQRSKVKVTRDKKRKSAESYPLTMHSTACAVGRTQHAATDDTIEQPPEGDGLHRWENQRMLSIFIIQLMDYGVLLGRSTTYVNAAYCYRPE